MLAMAAGDRHDGAAGVAGLSADGLRQQWPASDRFAMMVARREASPSALVLQLIEGRDRAHWRGAAISVFRDRRA